MGISRQEGFCGIRRDLSWYLAGLAGWSELGGIAGISRDWWDQMEFCGIGEARCSTRLLNQ